MLRILEKWIIRTVKILHDEQEQIGLTRYQLMKNESEVRAEFDITELREVKELFAKYKDPFTSP